MKGKGRHTCLLFIEALHLPLKYFLAFSANTPAEGEGEGVTGLAFFSVCFLCTTDDLFMHVHQAEVRLC